MVLRLANSGWLATSVVPPISGSCRATRYAVLRRHHVGLDEVRAGQDRLLVRRERVLGPGARRAAVADQRRRVRMRGRLDVRVDDHHLGVVGGARIPGVVAGVVVVVGGEQVAVAELDDCLHRHERERERVAHAVRAGRRGAADAVGVGDLEEVDDERLLDEALGIGVVEVDLVDPLEHGGRPVVVVALVDEQLALLHREGVAGEVGRLVGLVRPALAGVLPGRGVELVDPAAPLVGVVGEGALEDRVDVLAVRRAAHRLEAAARTDPGGLAGLEVGVLRGHAVRERHRRLQQLAGRAHVEEERAELVTDPERPVGRTHQGLDVEVRAGQQPVGGGVVDDREVDLVVRVAQRDEALDLDPAGPAVAGLPLGLDDVDAKQEVGGVGLGAEAVVRLGVEAAVVALDHGGEARDHLAGERAGTAVRRGRQGA